jgi:hypothetical protein
LDLSPTILVDPPGFTLASMSQHMFVFPLISESMACGYQ